VAKKIYQIGIEYTAPQEFAYSYGKNSRLLVASHGTTSLNIFIFATFQNSYFVSWSLRKKRFFDAEVDSVAPYRAYLFTSILNNIMTWIGLLDFTLEISVSWYKLVFDDGFAGLAGYRMGMKEW
jgi:hypothetical protein